MSATCKGCGAPLLWGETAAGKKIPLDAHPVKHLYTMTGRSGDSWAVAPAEGPLYLSHFVTCPKRDEFSKGRQKEERM